MQQLRDVRVNRGISQSKLAAKVGVTQTVISLLETNDIEPGEALLIALCKALDHDFTGKQIEAKGEEKMTQNQKVLQYMRENGSISQRDAVKFGCYRLSARIHDLRRVGFHIVSEEKAFKNEFGSGHYAEYKLVGEALR